MYAGALAIHYQPRPTITIPPQSLSLAELARGARFTAEVQAVPFSTQLAYTALIIGNSLVGISAVVKLMDRLHASRAGMQIEPGPYERSAQALLQRNTVVPARLPNGEDWTAEVHQHLQNLQSHIPSGQEKEVGGDVREALRRIITRPHTFKALTELIAGQNTDAAVRTLAAEPSSRFLFDALQGFLYHQRSEEEQRAVESRITDVSTHLDTVARSRVGEANSGRKKARKALGLKAEGANSINSETYDLIDVQLMALNSAMGVFSRWRGTHSEGDIREFIRGLHQDRSFSSRFKLGPQATAALYTDPAKVADWLPHDANLKQIFKEMQRRAVDQFPPEESPPPAPAAS